MVLDIGELRNSGLLELYVIGVLDQHEERQVEELVQSDPELKEELRAIERALEKYSRANSIKPPVQVKDQLMSEIANKENQKVIPISRSKNLFYWKVAAGIFLVAATVLLTQIVGLNKENESLKLALTQSETEIANLSKASQQQKEKFELLHDAESKLVALQSTEGFSQSEIYLYSNPGVKKNFLELKNLPPITADQSYQLWSLKPGVDPIPLDVFQGDAALIEVAFEEGTSTYAITIEPLGGRQTPTLENLIGTFGIG